ncbi:MAG: ribosome maturation factor RimM [Bacillota bacterium]
MKKIIIGQIIKAQGIKGEVKVKVYAGDLSRFLNYKKFFAGDKIFEVESSRGAGEFAFVKFKHVPDRNGAELLRGIKLEIEREQLPKLPDGDYYIFEAKVCDVFFEDGERLGSVVDILQHPAQDIFVVKTDKGEVMFPSLKDVVLFVDADKKKITINKKRYGETAVTSETDEIDDED